MLGYLNVPRLPRLDGVEFDALGMAKRLECEKRVKTDLFSLKPTRSTWRDLLKRRLFRAIKELFLVSATRGAENVRAFRQAC